MLAENPAPSLRLVKAPVLALVVSTIPETVAPLALKPIGDWIQEQVR